jgi:hypothetical protein
MTASVWAQLLTPLNPLTHPKSAADADAAAAPGAVASKRQT